MPVSKQGQGHELGCGDVEVAFASGECDHIITGTAKMGGQEHFYLEPQCSLIVPGEHDEFTVVASTQAPHQN